MDRLCLSLVSPNAIAQINLIVESLLDWVNITLCSCRIIRHNCEFLVKKRPVYKTGKDKSLTPKSTILYDV